MKRTMYEAARHTPKRKVGGSSPFWDAIIAANPCFFGFAAFCCMYSTTKSVPYAYNKNIEYYVFYAEYLLIGFERKSGAC